MKRASVLLAAFCLFTSSVARSAEPAAQRGAFPFKDGDRVVFLGDSITEQRLYTTYLETYLLTRFPSWKLQFRNAGWSGDTAWLRTRGLPPADALKRDVLDLHPTVVTIDFGMNDFGYGVFNQGLYDAHVNGQTAIIKQLKAANVLPVVVTPNAIEKNATGDNGVGLNEVLGQFAAGSVGVARRENVPFADQFTPYNDAINRLRTINPAARITVGDEVHPQQPGQLMMATYILAGLNAPSLVSSASVDARSGAASRQEGARISNVVRSVNGVSFQRFDRALVFPIEGPARPALQVTAVADEINRYLLRVTSLEAGTYTVSVNGTLVARFSADQLEKGVNLGYYESPLTAAGAEIMKHVRRKNDIYFVLWRQVRLGALSADERKKQIEAFEKEISTQERAINLLRQLTPFNFEIKRSVPAEAKPATAAPAT